MLSYFVICNEVRCRLKSAIFTELSCQNVFFWQTHLKGFYFKILRLLKIRFLRDSVVLVFWFVVFHKWIRFNGAQFLLKMKGKTIMFAGDSLGKNQWESLICLIVSSAPSSRTEMRRGLPLSTFRFLVIMLYSSSMSHILYLRLLFTRNCFWCIGLWDNHVILQSSVLGGHRCCSRQASVETGWDLWQCQRLAWRWSPHLQHWSLVEPHRIYARVSYHTSNDLIF